MKIVIVGAGALGTLFGGLLAQSGEEVWLYNPSNKEHIQRINQDGLIIEEKDGKHRISVKATSELKNIKDKADLVGIFVKAYHTTQAVKDALPLVGPDTQVLSVQNGLGNTAQIAKFVPPGQIIRGVTSLGSTLVGPGHIKWAGYGPTYIGEVGNGETEKVDRIVEAFNKARMKTWRVKDVDKKVWHKLLINAGINPLTAIFNVKNGDLITNPDLRKVMRSAVSEGVKVAQKVGIDMDLDETVEEVEEVCRLTSENISSMLQDVRNQKQTEIDYINGKVVEKGEKIGIGAPVNNILTTLIKEGVCKYQRRESR